MSDEVGRKRIPSQTPEAEVLTKLKAARHGRNLSQADVARQLGVKQQTYSDWERGGNCQGVSGPIYSEFR